MNDSIEGLTDPQVINILQHARDEQFAHFVTLAIGLAARTHPDIIRSSLQGVFDVGLIEQNTSRVMASAIRAEAHLQSLRQEVQDLKQEISELRKEVDAVQYVME